MIFFILSIVKDDSPAVSDISPWLVADPSQAATTEQSPPGKQTVITRKTVITTQL